MATEAQMEANRRNAEKSTGPRTEEGKETASRNATKFGLFSRHLVLRGEDADVFEQFHDGMYAQLKPVGELEKLYVERLIAAAWRLQRALSGEARVLALWRRSGVSDVRTSRDLMADEDAAKDLDRIQRHAASLERSMDKALAELKKLQENRPDGAEVMPIREIEPNSGVVEASARIEIVRTNPISMPEGKEESSEKANWENEANLPAAGDPGGGAIPAPTPEIDHSPP